MNETKSWLYEKISKIDLKKGGGGPNQYNQKWKRGSYNQLHRTAQDISDYCEQPCVNIIHNPEEMDKFLEVYNLPRSNEEEKYEQTNYQ